jgi:hypothetical protein
VPQTWIFSVENPGGSDGWLWIASDDCAIKVEPQVLERLAGVYESGKDVFTITREGGSLLLQKNQKPERAEIFAESPTAFFIKNDPATLSFETNADGGVERMVITPKDWLITIAKRRPL